MIKIHSPLVGLSYRRVFLVFLSCGEGHQGQLWEADKKLYFPSPSSRRAGTHVRTRTLPGNVFEAVLWSAGLIKTDSLHDTWALLFSLLFPLSEAYCWNTGWLFGFVKRGEEWREDGDMLCALILCSSAMEQSKPPYSLRWHLTGFGLSEQLSEMIRHFLWVKHWGLGDLFFVPRSSVIK